MASKTSNLALVLITVSALAEIVLITMPFLGLGFSGLRFLKSLVAVLILAHVLQSARPSPSPFRKELLLAIVTSLSLWYSLLIVFAIGNGLAINSYAPSLLTGLINMVLDTPLVLLAVLGLGELVASSTSIVCRLLLGFLAVLVFFEMFVNFDALASINARQTLLNTALDMVALSSLLASTLVILRYGSRGLALGYVLGIRLPMITSPILPFLPLALLSFLIILPSLFIILYASSRVAMARGYLVEGGPGAKTVIAAALVVFLFLVTLWKGYWPMIVLSGSMEPSIKIGDIVIVKKTSTVPRIGDVIAYKYSGIVILHRVINVTKDQIITKGDANDVPDNPITEDQVLGQLYIHIPYIGLPLIMVARLLGGSIFAAQMLLLAAIITLIMLPPIVRSLHTRKRAPA